MIAGSRPGRIVILADRTSTGLAADYAAYLTGAKAQTVICYTEDSCTIHIYPEILEVTAPEQPERRVRPQFTASGERKRRPWQGR